MFDETWIGEVRLVTAVVLVILGGGLAHALVFRHTSPQAKVDDIAVLCGALCGLPLAALVLATGFRPLLILLGLVAAVVQLEASARIESPRLEPLADPRLDLHFGIASGSAPFDALSLRLRSALAVHSIGDPPPRIMLLGGGAIFEAGADRRALTSVQLMVALHQATGKTVDVTVPATTFGHALQQALLYQRFYQRFTPKVIVLAVGPLESLPTERVAPRDVLAKGAEAGWSTGIRLLDLVLRTRDGDLPPSSPESLRATVLELHAFAAARNIPLVVATTADVDPDLAGVLADWSAETGTPFVPSIVDLDGGAQVAELATVLARVLR